MRVYRSNSSARNTYIEKDIKVHRDIILDTLTTKDDTPTNMNNSAYTSIMGGRSWLGWMARKDPGSLLRRDMRTMAVDRIVSGVGVGNRDRYLRTCRTWLLS